MFYIVPNFNILLIDFIFDKLIFKKEISGS